ncbi:ferredoxin [Mycobacterium branderi]|uniref:Ferredoxin n=2 Tax=Mycobacterium branderi TaxID=43348 RepID=A0A7I7WF10_9MYCO|nr:ferredoxin [Mycobacterium branderi]MCV7234657.1 ferredoxin [Mycobacterium branderi]ORA33191.1 hypothetical protein BST20_23370 [Mycobacterium branderi]BBZ15447.1 ferredoxin [Mycobacterium branderi]
MRITFDEKKCQGHAQCAANGPDFYPLDETGHCSLAEVTEVPAGLEAQAERGAAACPEFALSVTE